MASPSRVVAALLHPPSLAATVVIMSIVGMTSLIRGFGGYIVAMVYHYRANTFDSSALYVRNRLWQRPRDISLDITRL